jgi:hypothetical protein
MASRTQDAAAHGEVEHPCGNRGGGPDLAIDLIRHVKASIQDRTS